VLFSFETDLYGPCESVIRQMKQLDPLVVSIHFRTAFRDEAYGDSVCDHLQMTLPGVHIIDLIHMDILRQADVERVFTFHLIAKEYKWQVVHHFHRNR
jgi:hypothetical protein